ncbi:MAG: SdrD B-like domain-containing protein [Caldilineaceae bacterium]
MGDFVWSDLNSDGIRDAGEPGVSGVLVRLYRERDDGLAQRSDDRRRGLYLIDGVAAGRYYLGFRDGCGWPVQPFTLRDQGGRPDRQRRRPRRIDRAHRRLRTARRRGRLELGHGLLVPTAGDRTDEPPAFARPCLPAGDDAVAGTPSTSIKVPRLLLESITLDSACRGLF